MTQEEVNQKAFQVYAAIGELTIKKKQLTQQIEFIENQLVDLETQIVHLSTTPIEAKKDEK